MKTSFFQKAEHLRENQLLPAEKACPFCSSLDRERVAVLQRSPDVYLLTCRNCHASSASRMPTQETLDEYYRSYYERSYYKERERKVTIDIPEKLAAHIFTETSGKLHYKRSINILDFGGGNGEISVRLAKRFLAIGSDEVTVSLVDYTEGMLPVEDSRITLTRYAMLSQVRTQKYQIVIASAIIEHLPSPLQDIIDLFGVLQEGGIFYARTPYVLPFSKIFNSIGLKFDFQYPGHIHDLGSEFWNAIFEKLPIEGEYEYLKSKPSLVETSYKDHFIRTVLAYVFKAPWYLFGNGYGLVGGWEVFIRRKG